MKDPRLATPMTHADASAAIGGDGSDELALLLKRAGIVLPAERMAEVALEYASFRQQIALVNGVYSEQDEPALIFVARVKADGG